MRIILRCENNPSYGKSFSVYCDASIDGIGAVLTQKVKSTTHDPETNKAKTVLVDRPVQFCSKLFGKTERNWHVSEQEIFAVVYALEKWRPYLIHRKFTVYTDHLNLAELFNRAKNFKAGKLYRWAVRLQDYDFDARYIKGKKNVFADYLSRDALTLSYCPYHTQSSAHMMNQDIKLLYEQHLAHHSISNKNILYPHSDNSSSDPPSILILDRDPPRPHHTKSLKIKISNDNVLLPAVSDQYRDHAMDVDSDSDSDDDIKSDPPPDTSSLSSYINPSQSLDLSDGSNDVYSIPSPVPSLEATTTSNTISNTISNTNSNTNSNKYSNKSPSARDFNLRSTKNKRQQDAKQALAEKPLIQALPELEPNDPFHITNSINITNTISKNEAIAKAKPSAPTHNKAILSPNKTEINDKYNMATMTDAMIHSKQRQDPLLHAVILFLDRHNRDGLDNLPKYLRRMVLMGRYYLDQNKLLKYKFRSNRCIVVPAALRRSVLIWAHNHVHHGIDRMMRRLHDRYWWPYMKTDVTAFCKQCHACQCVKRGAGNAQTRGKMKPIVASEPFEMVSIDIVGPLPMTTNGDRYIVSMIDRYTRFAMLVPVKNIKANTIVHAYGKWNTLFGPPKSLLSDNGSQFISEIFRHYARTHGTKQLFASPYYPECNGMVERLHRWIKERLCLISVDMGLNFLDGDDWSTYIPVIQHAYNSTANSMTTYSPNAIIFGKDMKITLDRIDKVKDGTAKRDLTFWS